MYHDKKRGRILLKNGTSVLSSYGYAKNVINDIDNGDSKVASDFDSQRYDFLNNTDISFDLDEDVEPKPKSHIHTSDELDELIDLIENSERLSGTEEEISRIDTELEYFIRTNNVKFLLECVELIKRFRHNGVLWGVGRGSSCASFIAFLLEINDINPLKFDIDFRELSKEW